jgi:hypothetical protein
VGVTPPLGVVIASNCARRSSAFCHRSAGFFAKHRITTSASVGGTVSRCMVTGSGATWAESTT